MGSPDDGATASITCPGCGVSARAPQRALGRRLKCPRCGTSFVAKLDEPVPTRWEGPSATDAPRPTLPEASMPPAPAHPRPAAPTLPATPAAPREWQPGDLVLGLYEVTGTLGRGGMGRVYKVRHRGWDAALAVKVPLPEALRAAGGVDAFEREAETWVNLALHPHVVSCYYVRRVDGVPWVFAEYVDGGSLLDGIRARRFGGLEQVLDVAIQFAWGLHYAHEQGLVHRDVKPANVLVASDGVAKVTDFGLARARATGAPLAGGGGHTVTVAGGGGGTPAYMSPEQQAGRTLTRRSDLWGWALSLLEVFRGGRTWEHGTLAPAVLEEFLASGGQVGGLPALPGPVGDLLRRCFALDPDARPHTLAEAADSLADVYRHATGRRYPRATPTGGQQTAGSLNNRAVSLLDLGRGGAESLWDEALAAEPQHLESAYNRALRLWRTGRAGDDEVLARVDEAARVHAGEPRAGQLQGRLLLAAGEYRRAHTVFEASSALDPADAEIQRDLGYALCALGGDAARWERARACLARAMEAGDEQAADVAGYALTLARLGQSEQAAAFFSQAASRRRDLPPELRAAVALLVPGHEGEALLKGLAMPATALAVAGGHVIAAVGDRELRVWDAASGRATAMLSSADLRVHALALTPDGRMLVVAGQDGTAQLWELPGGRVVRSFARQPGFVTALAVTPDGGHLVTGGSDRVVRVLEIQSGRLVRSWPGHDEAVSAVAASTEAGLAASASLDGVVRVWGLEDGERAVLQGHRGRVAALAFTDGALLSAGEDRVIRLWDVASGRPLRVHAGHSQPVNALLVLGQERFVSAGVDRSVRIWDRVRGELLCVIRLEAQVSALAAAGGTRLWAASGLNVVALDAGRPARLPGHVLARPASVVEVQRQADQFVGRIEDARRSLREGQLERALTLVREARSIPGHERSDMALELWDEIGERLARAGLSESWELGALAGHSDPVLAVAVDASGGRAVSGGMDASIRTWDLKTRRGLLVLQGHGDTVAAVDYTPDGGRVVSGSWDRTLRVWDAANGRALRVLAGHSENVSGLSIAPDGRRVVSASWDATLRLWDLDAARPLGVFEGHEGQVGAVVFGPDARFVVSGGWDGTVRAWDVDTRACECLLQGHERSVGAVAVSPDGRHVASGSLDESVRLWDLRGRREIRALSGHTAEVTALAFLLDGRHLASASRDKTVRLWDLRSGRCVATIPHTGAVLALALTPSASVLLAAGTDLALRLWRLEWEAEPRPLPAWDDRAQAYLSGFASRHSVRTVRGAAAATVRWSDAEIDTLVADLRHRGFGGVERATVAAKLQDVSVRGVTASTWDDVRRSAPRAAAAQAVRQARRRLPHLRTMALAALVVLSLVGAYLLYRTRDATLGFSQHNIERVRKGDSLIDLSRFGAECTGGYEAALAAAVAIDVSADTLACLARQHQAGMVSRYVSAVPLRDEMDAFRTQQTRRNALSLLVGLAPDASAEMCGALPQAPADAQELLARALAIRSDDAALRCLEEHARSSSVDVRIVVAAAVPWAVSRERIGARRAWELAEALAQDGDGRVRLRAIGAVSMFDWDTASAALSRMSQDADADVADAGRRQLEALRMFRTMNPDLAY